MSTNNDCSKYVCIAMCFGTFVIFCSFLKDFNILDLLYLICVACFFVRYRLICRKEKRNQ